MKRHIIAGLLAFAALAAWQGASAQHTLGFTVGYGMGNGRGGGLTLYDGDYSETQLMHHMV